MEAAERIDTIIEILRAASCDPVATARGSDTMAIYPSEVQTQPQTNLARAHRARRHEEGIEEGLASSV